MHLLENDSVVLGGVSRDQLRRGPGLLPGTPAPGLAGNSVIAAHRITWGAPFSRLDELRKRSPYTRPQDWVFANDPGRPRWQESILDGHLKPAAARAGIGKIGWYTFRHTYSTMLRAAGVDIKVQQELLRHATIQSTLNVYTQAISEQKRTANTQLVEMVLLNKARPTSALQGLESQRILDGSQREPVAVHWSSRNVGQVTDA